ncbi:MAG: MBL fold metallo-hydrolase [Saccharofermentans sp.]|nr:MBL fold metallo-hydrolase [Saccharofermentans sp.]
MEIFVKKIRDGIFLLDEDHEATGYLIEGEDKALVIDTMNAHCDLKATVRSLTDKPLMVVNTHGHGDHIFGNMYFDEAYMNPADTDLSRMFLDTDDFREYIKERGQVMPPFKDIRGGDVIDLGGRTLEVYDVPGHTKGSIFLLLREDRILFAGDSVNHHLWLQLDGCPPVSEYVKTLESLMFLEKEADILLHGHADKEDDISLMSFLLEGLREITEGKTEDDLPYEYFGGIASQHPFAVMKDKEYSSSEHVICYRKDNV